MGHDLQCPESPTGPDLNNTPLLTAHPQGDTTQFCLTCRGHVPLSHPGKDGALLASCVCSRCLGAGHMRPRGARAPGRQGPGDGPEVRLPSGARLLTEGQGWRAALLVGPARWATVLQDQVAHATLDEHWPQTCHMHSTDPSHRREAAPRGGGGAAALPQPVLPFPNTGVQPVPLCPGPQMAALRLWDRWDTQDVCPSLPRRPSLVSAGFGASRPKQGHQTASSGGGPSTGAATQLRPLTLVVKRGAGGQHSLPRPQANQPVACQVDPRPTSGQLSRWGSPSTLSRVSMHGSLGRKPVGLTPRSPGSVPYRAQGTRGPGQQQHARRFRLCNGMGARTPLPRKCPQATRYLELLHEEGVRQPAQGRCSENRGP